MIPPVITYNPTYPNDEAIFSAFLAHMDSAEKAVYLDLHNCKNNTCKAAGIADTNTISAGRLPGLDHEYGAVCKMISRINHRFVKSYIKRELEFEFNCLAAVLTRQLIGIQTHLLLLFAQQEPFQLEKKYLFDISTFSAPAHSGRIS